MEFTKKRWFGFSLVTFTYLVAGIVGFIVYNALPFSFWLDLLISDIVATIVVFVVSVICKNSSVYDPYWSVQPIVIVLAYLIKYGFNLTGLLIFIAISIWGIRLTLNWCYNFYGMGYEDWRYVSLKEKTGKLYPFVNFSGIHLVPTLVVYGCVLPAVYIIRYQMPFKPLMSVFLVGIICFVLIQGIADIQMHKFRKNKTSNFIRNGLWKHSRHPNYLGEIGTWWCVGLCLITLNPNLWYLLAGAFANTLLFLFISIPLADNRQSKKEGFLEYKKQTRMLLPIKKFIK